MPILVATDLKKHVETTDNSIDILKGVDLKINSGEVAAILGSSGSGKTTLLSLLAGLDVPSSGKVFFNGIELTALSEDERATSRKGQIGFIFQHFELLPSLNALENVMLPAELANHSNIKEQALALLTKVGLKERLFHYPNQLSGGERQRIAIARSFVIKPKLLFADEPTGSLDQKTGNSIINLLFDLKHEYQSTMIFVTHDPLLAKRCDNTYLLENGKLNLSRVNNDL